MGNIIVVGIGPGGLNHLTPAAKDAILAVDVIVGYHTYINMIEPFCRNKEIISTGMTGEVERCQQAIAEAERGKSVAVISSGDAGIYGMAGLIYELLENHVEGITVKVIPGVTAASAAGSILGAPLMNDFAVISLSDLLTPEETIRNRVAKLAEADMVCAVYNPASKKRRQLIRHTIRVFMKCLGENGTCGYVKNATRERQESWVGALAEFPFDAVDMTTIVIIGNSKTKIMNGKLVTRRGYLARTTERE